jgi:hypothetical protein
MNCVLFPFRSSLVEEVLLTMVKKNHGPHVLADNAFATIVFASFDLWMFHNGVDNFDLVINFLNDIWVPMRVNVGCLR